MTGKLDQATFLNIVRDTPLVSIDLIIRNDQGAILLGQRCNKPAQGYWFVPGGRVLKNESLAQAFQRLCHEELASDYAISSARFKACYEHFYPENFAEAENIDTHYIVLAYEINYTDEIDALPVGQHSQYQWFTKAEAQNNQQIHRYSRDYFVT